MSETITVDYAACTPAGRTALMMATRNLGFDPHDLPVRTDFELEGDTLKAWMYYRVQRAIRLDHKGDPVLVRLGRPIHDANLADLVMLRAVALP